MVGGRDFFGAGEQAKVNLAMGRGRHTGSAFKPIVLAAALQDGVPLSEQLPAPGEIDVQCPGAPVWHVGNYSDSGPAAPVDLAEATVRSYNTVYAQLINQIGPERAIEMAHAMGITTPLQAVCPAVLGANDVQVLEMASVYATFANRGVHVAPVMVTSVERADGTVLYESTHAQDRAFDPEVADQVSSVLTQAVDRGTGTRARIAGRPVAGKTGTGQDYRNAWFCGYVPQLATAVWIGFPGRVQYSMSPPNTSISVTGGSWPAQIWQQFMSTYLADSGTPVAGFNPPPTTVPPAVVAPPPTATTAATAPPVTEPPVVMPDVRGQTVAAATSDLRALGLRVAVAAGPAGGPVAPGTVVGQSPAPTSPVPAGGVVSLEVVPPPDDPQVVPQP
jgi:penicillin-binding protein 1A